MIDGEAGDDYVHGDATIDHILDTGGGFDTLSFATGVTPGFDDGERRPPATNFPVRARKERGDLARSRRSGGEQRQQTGRTVPAAAATTKSKRGSFETVIGTPFSDYIVGSQQPPRRSTAAAVPT